MLEEPATKRRRLSPPINDPPGFAKWDLERDYREKLLKKGKKEPKSQKLPIKTSEGWVEQVAEEVSEPKEQEELDSGGEIEDGDSGVADLDHKPAEPAQPKLSMKEQVIAAKEDLARIAGNISEAPEDNIAGLGTLAQIADTKIAAVKKLALATQLAVYKDIIPGYRIRPLSKDDLHGKVSKDVKRLRSFEQGLLSGYKAYVIGLGKLARKSGSNEAKPGGVESIAVGCVCELIKSVPHFNMRNDLIGILVHKLSTRQLDADYTKCREAMEHLFREDEDGHSSLEAVSQMTRMMRSKDYNIHESTLNTFLHLRLLSELNIKASTNSVDKPVDQQPEIRKHKKKDREFRTKKERKLMRERKVVEKEMKEADATVSFEERDKNQSETLKLVFVAYFRILKARYPGLMGAVLEGLARYSHLINQDFFGDILEALKDLINAQEEDVNQTDDASVEASEDRSERNISRESLLCIITAFALLQGQQDVTKQASILHLDLNYFITHLYQTLLPVSVNPDIELSAKKTQHLADPNGLNTPATQDNKVNVATTSALLIRSLSSALLPPANTRAVPPSRVAAFCKQLMTSALHLPPKSAQAILALLRQVTKVHGNKVAALWHSEERKGDGVFDPLSAEVEASNPFATTIWEGEVLRCHFDPGVRDMMKGIERNVKEARA